MLFPDTAKINEHLHRREGLGHSRGDKETDKNEMSYWHGGMNHSFHVVVAANAGGAFSPFGDITTLMVWQKGIIPFQGFLVLFLPSAVNWLVPAGIMSLTLGKEKPAPIQEKVYLQPGAFVVVGLFLCTIATAVSLAT